MMNEQSLDTLTASIAKEHGIVLNADDPVLILHTINAHLVEENKKAQKALLESFRQEMEVIVSRWHTESKETAERILNASLHAAKNAMMEGMQDFSGQYVEKLRKATQDAMETSVQKAQRAEYLAKWNLAAAVITFLSACMMLTAFLFH